MTERLYGGRPIEFFENNYTKFVDDGWAENIIRDMTDHIRELNTALDEIESNTYDVSIQEIARKALRR